MSDQKSENETLQPGELPPHIELDNVDTSDVAAADVPAEDDTERPLLDADEGLYDQEELQASDALDSDQKTDDADVADGLLDSADPAAHDEVDLGDSEPDEDPEDVEKGDPYGGHQHEVLTGILESALFASGATLSVSHLRDIFEPHERPHGRIVRQIMAELIASYENKGVHLVEVASGYRFQTDPGTAQWISRLWEEKPQRYSRALMETIALIAYRQPITRGEIEDVRGVAVSSNIIRTLLEREWVRVVGHRDVPGRPAMYATTRQFLDYFSLKSLDQLPNLSEIRDMDELNPQMNLDSGEAGEGTEGKDDSQSEITFDAIANRFALHVEGKTGSEFIDEQLDDELAAMDDVNTRFESALEQQRAEHEHPALDLDDDEEGDEATQTIEPEAASEWNPAETDEPESSEPEDAIETSDEDLSQPKSLAEIAKNTPSAELSEEEQWKIIQEKLAEQQALLDNRENDSPREEDDNE
ncbi:SMC-Scp complex subunit ScpB [Reinekea sp. G2M2-21]|uniref:SMC-Scp complex subunit ScpB n=1 Tax=Reinekea sp. G2M2-21 TaxID=2788942 RepID=UPI0018AA6DC3|nr:SMC-Scp complex subunit ScpB [Reinekea sp. G2M2-21]